ncbi:MAG: cadherin-like beta sandwich domain-containing protein [Gemmatimonadaceae bacterium]|nr:cadherin-like beta sandwich domain-containing protein [Gemmatimonadaceae bacterium]
MLSCAALLLAAASGAASPVSYDSDGDGLIEISSLTQLNAIRWDLDGDGAADNSTNASSYAAAFPDAAAGMGCPTTSCTGYELNADLDFDTSGDGAVNSADEYWNGGAGWEPIGDSGSGNEFIATFDGTRHTITRLYIDRSSGRIGLFGVVGDGGQVRNLGVLEVAVTGSGRGIVVGGLAGTNAGVIAGSYVTGAVSNTGTGAGYVGGLVGRNAGSSGASRSIVASHASASVTGSGSHGRVGGLAGYNYGSIRASYATGAVRGTGGNAEVGGLVGFHNGGSIAVSYASGAVTGESHVGGLVGKNWGGGIWACHASGAVTGDGYVGGLVGEIQGSIRASYATGWVTGTGTNVGGLVGRDYDLVINNRPSSIRNCYWNTVTSGRVTSAGGEGKTTAELQTPTGYAGIYAAWNVDVDNADGDYDGTTGGDDPWEFGTAQQYPALRADLDGDGTASWREFGEQRPDASPPTDAGSPDDATLKALGVSPVDIEGFSADVLAYHIGVAHAVSQVTVTPYPSDEGATIDINGTTVSSGSGHTVSMREGRNPVIAITVTAQDGTTTKEYSIAVDRGSDAPFRWKVVDDFNDLDLDHRWYGGPYGIWSNGTTMWVTCPRGQNLGEELCSYSMASKKQGPDFHTLETHGNRRPMGITSDGTTMWVSEYPRGYATGGIYAYNLSNYARNSSREFDLVSAGIDSVGGLAVDPVLEGFWVVADGKLLAFNRHSLQRNPQADFNTLEAAGNTHIGGIWTDGHTMWVADIVDDKLYAYDRNTKQRAPSKDFNWLIDTDGRAPWGIWSDGETMWVTGFEIVTEFVPDRERWVGIKIQSYNMPSRVDATLRGLTVTPRDITGFSPDVTTYDLGVANDVTQVSLTPTVNLSGGTIDVDGSTVASGASHSVSLSEGRNDVTITVTADDGRTTKIYTVTVVRSVAATFGWNAAADFNTLDAAGNRSPGGIWSDGTTMWVVDTGGDKIYAYSMATTARDAAKDLDAPMTAGNNSPGGLWSDGTTMWVSDSEDDKLYAYSLSAGARDASRDFDGLKAAGNEDPAGIWSDDSTMWVVDDEDNRIYAYDLRTKARDSARDFDYVTGPGSGLFEYIWSDSTTIWVANWSQSRLYAYYLASGARDSSRDFATLRAAGNGSPRGIWSDGVTMWVADGDIHDGAKIYAYNMPAAAEPPPPPVPPAVATLGSLSVRPVEIAGFSADVTTYHVGVANSVTQVSITATATDAGSTIDMGGISVSSGSSYPVSLTEGRNEVTITVTASDGQTTKAYTVVVGRGVAAPFGWKAVDDFNTLVPGNNHPAGLWSDGTTLWVANYNNAPESKIFAYNLSTKARDASKDFNTLKAAGNDDPRGLWSDGTTMWVADGADARIYAYSLSTKARDAARDFGTLGAAGNNDPRGLWSDGTTMWVVNHDNNDDKVFAYSLATKARDAAKDVNTLRSDGNQRAFGIWSDGVTLWVGDSLFLRLFAYDLATGSRDSSRDFSALHPTLTHVTLGIWSDGETMWVTDLVDRKIYSYNMPSGAGGTQAQATTDFNGDGRTDFADFFLFIDAYGTTDARFDLDGNGTVDFADFFRFIDAFNPSGQAKLVAMARELIGLPGETELRQNWPNPFNSETVFSWFLLQPGPVRLEVFSLTGQRLAVLRQGPQPTGYHRLRWDGRDGEGRPLASGVYLFRLVTGETVLTRKLTLLR